ncbi:hypothetical protein B0H11DRAFT_1730133, partial [Mycena galericulata]
CGNTDLKGKELQSSNEERFGYGHAYKMKSAILDKFRKLGTGREPWVRGSDGQWGGNPAMSNEVSDYLHGLHREKVQAGETSLSSRAITLDELKLMYDFSNADHRSDPENYRRTRTQTSKEWATPRKRLQLHCMLLISVWCLLRADEVLRIRTSDLTFVDADGETPESVVIALQYRKNRPHGDKSTFRLYLLPAEEAYMCPVRALAHWLHYAKEELGDDKDESGNSIDTPLFRKVGPLDQVLKEPLPYDTYLTWLRHILIDIDIQDIFAYGTHSGRRGGCQIFHIYMRWSLRKIADWGGWSYKNGCKVIITYLLGLSDSPVLPRGDFLNPDKDKALKLLCRLCGRDCSCNSY